MAPSVIFSVNGLYHPNLSVSFILFKERVVARFLECAVDLIIPQPHSFSSRIDDHKEKAYKGHGGLLDLWP